MKNVSQAIVVSTAVLVAASSALGNEPTGTMAITLSMEQPSAHYYHVVFRCEGLVGETQDFKMPAWTPGYYQIMDFARNVRGFRAEDEAGNPLPWQKTTKNTWRVKSGQATSVTVSYDVYAFGRSVADSYLDDTRGYISPAAVFMHVAGQIRHPVTISVRPHPTWSRVSTGLEPLEGRPSTFVAPDFDVLYDCPILLGSQEVLSFEVRGIPHFVVLDVLESFDRTQLAVDMRRMIEVAVAIIGEVPYRHYAFMVMGGGRGGLEHQNSTALMIDDPYSLKDPVGYRGWLRFVAHEFFHLYNVKRIRPVALGPFDYDAENYTRMLWMSEGLTVYYEDLILRRAGFLTREEYFERARTNISQYESTPGHQFQSATEASFDTWIHFFNRGENAANTTISYYDKGAALGMLLDLKIRHESKNRRSLDHVMRALYQDYYRERARGFTDDEFREACETAAGTPLAEVFDVYASTAKDIDYPRYLAYAGLDIDLEPRALPGAYLGAVTESREGRVVVSSVEWDSPAQRGGLSARDEILGVDGVRATSRAIDEMLKARRSEETIRMLIARRDRIHEVEIVLGKKMERSFRIRPVANPSPLQSTILTDWLRD